MPHLSGLLVISRVRPFSAKLAQFPFGVSVKETESKKLAWAVMDYYRTVYWVRELYN